MKVSKRIVIHKIKSAYGISLCLRAAARKHRKIDLWYKKGIAAFKRCKKMTPRTNFSLRLYNVAYKFKKETTL